MKMFDFYDLNYNARKDEVLKWFALSFNARPEGDINGLVTFVNFMSGSKYSDFRGNIAVDIQKVLDRLVEDKNIKEKGFRILGNSQVPAYSITDKGAEYLLNGGYSGEYEYNSQAKKKVELMEKITLANNYWMKVGAVVAAVFAVLSFFRDLLKDYLKVPIETKACYILLFFGTCVGIAITGLIQELVQRRSK